MNESTTVIALDDIIQQLNERKKHEGSEFIVDTGWHAAWQLAQIVQQQQLEIEALQRRWSTRNSPPD